MTTAVIGVGHIGTQVATRLAAGGEKVYVAASSLQSAEESAQRLGHGIEAGTVSDVIDRADQVIFAVMFPVIQTLLKEHASELVGKIVVDPSNNFRFDDGKPVNANPEGESAGSQIQALVPEGASYVKAFGTMAAAQLGEERTADGEKVTLLFATDDDAAGEKIARLIETGGWDAVKVGGVDRAADIEVLGKLHPFGGLNDRLLSKAEVEELIID
ncbi:NAD(P)-binding domain-containing protein [Rothia sp. LK2588]|uniref:NADPH-dependent F420 reductase n=1 Tax=Rothia sp. LK2588 TaxID=3114369 RepID=UPI0034CF7122